MKTLLLDIETAPHRVFTWGLFNQNVAINQIEEPGYTLCWAAKWYDDQVVYFNSLWDHGRTEMLNCIHALMNESDVIVHYNGDKFDIPMLNQEFLLSRMSPPSPSSQIDLYKVMKKRFAFPSNKLNYISEQLGNGRKVDHKGMELWRKVMEGDKKAQDHMKKYNMGDINLLESLYTDLIPWIPNHPNAGLYDDTNDFICPNCGSSNIQHRGVYHAKTQSYKRFRCNDCGKWSRSRISILDADKRKFVLVGVE